MLLRICMQFHHGRSFEWRVSWSTVVVFVEFSCAHNLFVFFFYEYSHRFGDGNDIFFSLGLESFPFIVCFACECFFSVANFFWIRLRLISAEIPLNRENWCISIATMHDEESWKKNKKDWWIEKYKLIPLNSSECNPRFSRSDSFEIFFRSAFGFFRFSEFELISFFFSCVHWG